MDTELDTVNTSIIEINENIAEISSISVGKTNMIVYNPEDDWSYINGVKYQYVGLVWDGYFYNNGVNSKNFQSNHSNFRCSSTGYSISFETNYIKISNAEKGVTGNGVGIVSDNVDLSRFSTIYFELKKVVHGNGGFSVAVGERDTMKATSSSIDGSTAYKSISLNTSGTGTYTVTIDISDLDEVKKQTCAIGIYNWAGYSGTETLYVLAVYVE